MLPFSEACERNQGPILGVLRSAFANCSRALEIGSGTGQHAVYFAANLQHLVWQPSERFANFTGLQSRVRLQGGGNLRVPAVLDVNQKIWPVSSVDAVFSANTLHIMSWPAVQALFAGIDSILEPGGDDVRELAACCRMSLGADHEMPANNRLLEFRRID